MNENTTIGVVLIIVCVLVVVGVLAACIKGRTWGNALYVLSFTPCSLHSSSHPNTERLLTIPSLMSTRQNKARSNNEQRRSRKSEQGSAESAGPAPSQAPSQPANDAEGSAYHEFPAQTGDNDTVYNFVCGELQREKEASEERERAEAAAAAKT